MYNKKSLGLMVVFCTLFLFACGDAKQGQSYEEHLTRAEVYQEQGQYKAAIIEYKNAVKKSQGSISAYIQYAGMLNHLGQHASALSMLEQVSGEKDSNYYYALAHTFFKMRKFFSAKDIISNHLDQSSPKVKLLLANIGLAKGELKASLNLFDSLMSEPGFKDEALLGKATVLAQAAKPEEAVQFLNKVDQKSDAAVKSNIMMANIQIAKQELEAAEATLSNVLAGMKNTDIIEPKKVVVLDRLSYILTRLGRSNEAYIYTKILSEAFPGSNEVKNQFEASVQKMDEGDLSSAKEMLQKILTDYPNYSRATQLLGVISYLEGDIEGAHKYLSDSVDPEVANEMTRHIYAATNLKLNDPKKVLEILEPGIEETKQVSTLALYGVAAISDKQYQKGEAALLKALSIDDKNVRVKLALANYYRNKPSPDLTKEKSQLDSAYSIAPTDKQVLMELVSYIVRNQGFSEAEVFLNTSLKKYPDDLKTNFLLGSLHAAQQKNEQALAQFTKALALSPEGDEKLNIMFAKGRVELALKKVKEAESTFSVIVKGYPKESVGYKGLMSVYLLKNDLEGGIKALENYGSQLKLLAPYAVLIEMSVARQDLVSAKKYFDQAKKLDVDKQELASIDHAIRYVEAGMALKVDDFSEARSIISSLLSEDPENLRFLSFLVDIELKAGQINEASKILDQINVISPDHPIVNIFKADIAIAKNDLNAAKTFLNNAWHASPKDLLGEKLYKVLGAMGDNKLQSKHLNDWLDKIPQSPVARLYQGIYYQQTMQRAKAIESYEFVLESLPNNAMALNNLGWLYFEKNDDRSLTLLKKAVELAPENAAVLDSYGWVLAKSGRKQEGLKYLEKAHQLAPNEAEIKAHLDEVKSSN